VRFGLGLAVAILDFSLAVLSFDQKQLVKMFQMLYRKSHNLLLVETNIGDINKPLTAHMPQHYILVA